MKIDAATFRLRRMIVNGTFMTAAFVRCGDARVSHNAKDANMLNYGWRAAALTCSDERRRWIFPNTKHACVSDNLTVTMEYATMHIRCRDWYVKTSVRQVFDVLSGTPRRIDFRVSGSDVRRAHGIVGQNLRQPRNGNVDVYPESEGVVFQTSAQAEGAIEGTVHDYIVGDDPFGTTFAFSNYDAASSPTVMTVATGE